MRAIADHVGVENGEITVDLPYVSLELFESNIQGRIFYRVVEPKGKTITGYDDLPLPPEPAAPNQPVFYRAQYHGEAIYLAAMSKPLYDPDIPGAVLIAVGETSETRQALSRRILLDQLRREGMLILVAALVVWLGLKGGLAPAHAGAREHLARAATDVTPIDDSEVQTEVAAARFRRSTSTPAASSSCSPRASASSRMHRTRYARRWPCCGPRSNTACASKTRRRCTPSSPICTTRASRRHT